MSSDESYESSDADEDRPIPDKVPKEIKSVESVHRSYLNFKNLSDECVYLFWVDFDGKPISYGKINPGNRCDNVKLMHSFVSHPWFAISNQKKQFHLNDKIYFFPPRHETWHHEENGWLNQKWVLKVPEESFDNPSTIVKNEIMSDVDENIDNTVMMNDQAESSDNHQPLNVASNNQINVGIVEFPVENVVFDFQYLDDSGDDDNDSNDENDDFENLVDDFEDLVFDQPLVNITHREQLEPEQYYEVLILPPGCMSLRKLCLIKCCELFPSLKLIDDLDIASVFKTDIRLARKKYFSIITPELIEQ